VPVVTHPQARAVIDHRSCWTNLSGMSVLVTGASSGIGRASAVALAECGADLILLARNEQSIAEVHAEIERNSSTRVDSILADVTDARATRRQIEAMPKVDALVNNAGCNIPQSFEDVDEPSFDSIFALNVRGAFFVAQACVAKFRKQGGGGAIVNVSSQMGHVGAARRSVYCASKHALEGLTKALAVELAAEGIRVNAVAPTFIATAMTAPMFEEVKFTEEVRAKIPLGRIGTPGDVVGAIVFLLSPAASLITGASLLIDGGWTAQ
jgi:NAD(P)-dependent dehydrogenase (short-subunit alcohol dehydrogenase family)